MRNRLADSNGAWLPNLPMTVERNWLGIHNEVTYSVRYREYIDRHWHHQQEATQAMMVYKIYPQLFDAGAMAVRIAFEKQFGVPWGRWN